MVIASASEAMQLAVGALLGFMLSLNLDRHGLRLSDPKTRWTALGIIVLFFATFLLITEPLLS